jgi:oligopeptide/dipeptide ABC transporter ATP-binding protein
MSDEPLLLEVKNLKTAFDIRGKILTALDGINFEVKQGKTLGIIGESGCGKSVTALSILRIIPPPGKVMGGEVLLYRQKSMKDATSEAVDLVKLDPHGDDIRKIRGAEIAMVFQEPMSSLTPVYTIGFQIMEVILLHQNVNKKEARARAIKMLELVGMPQPTRTVDSYPHQLSGGMLQRAMIAQALSCNPRLLIADEPTTALDVTIQAQILKLMRRLQDELGMAIMFITHDLGVIAEMSQDVAVMYLGKVVEKGDVVSIFHDPKHPYTQALLKSIPKVDAQRGGRLLVIEGNVPNLLSIPKGCAFHPRCPVMKPGICDQIVPKPVVIDRGREVECLLYEGELGRA